MVASTRSKTSPEAAATDLQHKTQDPQVMLPVEDVPRRDKVDGALYHEFEGVEFRLSDDTSLMALMEWAAAADSGDNGRALVSLYHVLQDVVHEDDWQEFAALARTKKSKDELGKFVNGAMEKITARPTKAQ